jgi:hypothetical protein
LYLLKAAQSRQDWHGRLSNVVRAVCPLFKRELFIGNLFAGFQNRQDCPLAGFQKLTMQLREIFYPIGAKDWTSLVLKSFLKIQKFLALNS